MNKKVLLLFLLITLNKLAICQTFVFPGESFEQRGVTTATQSSTVITATNITGLNAILESGKKYQFEAWILYSSAATTTGIALACNPVVGNIWHYTGVNSSTIAMQERRFFNSSTLYISTSSIATTGNVAYMCGRIEATANGTFQISFATEVAGSAITIQPNSILTIKQVK